MPNTTLHVVYFLKTRLMEFARIGILICWLGSAYLAFNSPSKYYLLYGCGIAYFVFETIANLIVIRRKLRGQVLIPRVKKNANFGFIICTGLFIINYFLLARPRLMAFTLLMPISVALLAECIGYCLYKFSKPIGLVIDGTCLLVNDRVIIQRNLENLTSITLNDMEDAIMLGFLDQRRLKIIIREYLPADLLLCVNTAITFSKNLVEVQPLIYKKLQPPLTAMPFFRKISKGLKEVFLP